MIDVSIFTNSDFLILVCFLFCVGLFSWFMGWGVSFVTSLFIKIIGKE